MPPSTPTRRASPCARASVSRANTARVAVYTAQGANWKLSVTVSEWEALENGSHEAVQPGRRRGFLLMPTAEVVAKLATGQIRMSGRR